ncbi:MAG: c-type cytochrome [Pseudomonadota bacterium]
MRILILVVAVLGMSVAWAGDEEPGKAAAKSCLGCHAGKLSLKGRGTETLVEQITAIRAGEKAHPPGLAKLSEEDIAAIAAYLDQAE